MKNRITIALFVLTASSVFATGTLYPGTGIRASSMGYAYTAVANDVTAIYWNPARLADIEGIGIYGGSTISFPEYSYVQSIYDETSVSDTPPVITPSGGIAWNGLLNGKITIGFAVYIPAGLHIEIPNDESKRLFPRTNYLWKNNITVYEFAPGIAYSPIPQLSIGGALYIDYGVHNLSKSVYLNYSFFGPYGRYSEESTGLGIGGVIGVKANPIDVLSIGFAFKPKRTLSMNGSASIPEFATLLPEEYRISPTSDFTRDLSFPTEISTGLALDILESFTLSADFRYIYWEGAMDIIVTDFADPDWDNSMGTTSVYKDLAFGWPSPYVPYGKETNLDWRNTKQYGYGIEYRVTEMFAARAGYYRKTALSPNNTYLVLWPNIDMNAYTFGFGANINRLHFDAAFEYSPEESRVIDGGLYYPEYPRLDNQGIHSIESINCGFSVTAAL